MGFPTHGGRGGWIAVAEIPQLRVGPARMIVARLALAVAGALLIVATQ